MAGRGVGVGVSRIQPQLCEGVSVLLSMCLDIFVLAWVAKKFLKLKKKTFFALVNIHDS